ncbi:NADPH-dependent 2,4-dienoyl-CoA reductase/sulfur reductase-like enzyme [Hypnocyclicus thermotrophus]|uniref:NADPH-dependent 2,4-dienoyl-CoA reductase/sulfur reductase-like enzyme n=1 Tax=Hypnocyclicus thermotrophus TaxID=1627895 RepID=A0AA46I6E9_9FUSO|nr:FAD-dependent oxidoreductase [Hypnocyclicus thermotrophus]TDT72400.1 NADPH-dependent 2,4-dienoyl-CoA reductase/sulfur reductase-like enzyme [Hypnocyclicus thermotrophus]
MNETIVIIGGGAGGMTTASQLKKISPEKRVVVFDKGPYVSWAGCPTPYYIAEELPFKSVVHFTPEFFRGRGIEIYENHKVIKIDKENKKIMVEGKEINGEFGYDKLVLSLGGKSFVPKIKNYNNKLENLFKLSHAVEAEKIKDYIDNKKPKKAVVVGSGFIGLEMAEAFKQRGLDVVIVEAMDKIFPTLNENFRKILLDKMKEKDIKLLLNEKVVEIKNKDNKVTKLIFESGNYIEADIFLLAIGLRPNLDLLIESGFELEDNKLETNEKFETKYKDIYALGDMVYNKNLITKKEVYAPFGDVADKQGIILSKILSGKNVQWRGIIGTFATSFFDIKIAKTGLTYDEALKEGYNVKSINVTGVPKVSGFKDSTKGTMEIIYDDDKKIILGASMLGYEAVAQFIDQVAIAITYKISIEDLFYVDYAYSPTNASVWNPLVVAYRKACK